MDTSQIQKFLEAANNAWGDVGIQRLMILFEIAAHSEITQNDLATNTNLSPSKVSKNIVFWSRPTVEMQDRKGLVHSDSSPSQTRRLFLTQKGHNEIVKVLSSIK